MQTRTLLIDGSFLLKRSYHAGKTTFNSKGKNIGGLYGFLITLRMLIKDYNINKCVVSFDSENSGKLRYNIYSDYKSNRENKEWHNKRDVSEKQAIREEMEKTLSWQKMRINQYLEDLHVRQLNLDIVESDDVLAYYCKKYHEKEYILIFTNDRDFCQLVNYDNVNIYVSNMKTVVNKDNYFLYFNHDCRNSKLLKIICGDTSDNIKGIKMVTSDTLLKFFPKLDREEYTLERILEETKVLNEERVLSKKKPLQSLYNLENKIFKEKNSSFELNEKLVDLGNPILNTESICEIEATSEYPMDLTNRNSKNLIKMMTEDEFLTTYNFNFVNFVTPFYNIILKEKQLSNN